MTRRVVLWILLAFYALLWVGGTMSHALLDEPPPAARYGAPLFLATASLIVLIAVPTRFAGRVLLCGLLGLVAEWVGMHTGWPFGQYVYTDQLPPRVWGVPVAMASAWIVLLAYVAERLHAVRGRWLLATLGATWMTAIDLLIDPVAAEALHYWTWHDPGAYCNIPTQNFFGWWAVSFMILALVPLRPGRSAWLRGVGLSILVFFGWIALRHGLYVPAAVGGTLAVLDAVSGLLAGRRAGVVASGHASGAMDHSDAEPGDRAAPELHDTASTAARK